jgi:hypothetical protein
MQSQLSSQRHVWGVLPAQFQSELTLHKSEICRLSGFLEEYGPVGANYTGEGEELKLIDELTGFLVQAADLEAGEVTNTARGVGRPRDVITPYLAPELLSIYLRFHNSGGRQSVLTSIDGQPGQKEAGPLFEFIKKAIEPLNHYLTTDLNRKPLSAARLARFALSYRRKTLRAIKWMHKKAQEKKALEEAALRNVIDP